MKKKFRYVTNSNAFPFFSESGSGSIDAKDPMSALKKLVRNYDHPAGLYAAAISEDSDEGRTLARYLSARAASKEGEKEVYEIVKGKRGGKR